MSALKSAANCEMVAFCDIIEDRAVTVADFHTKKPTNKKVKRIIIKMTKIFAGKAGEKMSMTKRPP